MDDSPIKWDAYNRRHITEDHPERAITIEEVEQVMSDLDRVEAADQRPDGLYQSLIGRTQSGRLLFVAYVAQSGGRYPVHARQAGRKLSGRYNAK